MARRSKRIGAIDLENAISQVLSEYGTEVYRVLGVCCREVSEEAVQKLHQGGGYNGTGAYNADWTYKYELTKRFHQGYIVYNDDHYRLAHLLEKGHLIRNGTERTYGSTSSFPHIKPVEQWAQEELPRKVRTMLS